MNIQPIGKRIIIKKEKNEEKTSSGIILTSEIERKKYEVGVILAISGDDEMQSIFKINDKIIYLNNSAIEINETENNIIILEKEDVLAILK